MTADLVGILVVEPQYQFCQRLALVERLLQFAAYVGQLEVKKIGMTGFEVVQQGGDADLFIGLKLAVVVGREVDYRQESVCIHMVVVTGLFHCLVTKTKTDAKTAQHLQQVVIIADQRDHLVVRLIHLLIFHTY